MISNNPLAPTERRMSLSQPPTLARQNATTDVIRPRTASTGDTPLTRVIARSDVGMVQRTEKAEKLKKLTNTDVKLAVLDKQITELGGETIKKNSGNFLTRFFKAAGSYIAATVAKGGTAVAKILSHVGLGIGHAVVGATANLGLGLANLGVGIAQGFVGLAYLISGKNQKVWGAMESLISAQKTLGNAHQTVQQGLVDAHGKVNSTLTKANISIDKGLGLRETSSAVDDGSHASVLVADTLSTLTSVASSARSGAEQIAKLSDALSVAKDLSNFAAPATVITEGVGALTDLVSVYQTEKRLNRIENYEKNPKEVMTTSLKERRETLMKELKEAEKNGNAKEADKLRGQLLRITDELRVLRTSDKGSEVSMDTVDLMRKNQTQARNNRIFSFLKKAAVAIGMGIAIAAIGVAVASNPVGWAIAGVALGVTVGMGIYSAYKKRARVENITALEKGLNTAQTNFTKVKVEYDGVKELVATTKEVSRLQKLKDKGLSMPNENKKLEELTVLKDKLAGELKQRGVDVSNPQTTLADLEGKVKKWDGVVKDAKSYLRQTSPAFAVKELRQTLHETTPPPDSQMTAAALEAFAVVSQVFKVDPLKIANGDPAAVDKLEQKLGMFYA